MIRIRFLSSMIVRFHGFTIIPFASSAASTARNACSIPVKNVDITLPLPFNSSSKLVNAAHQLLPSGVCTAYICIWFPPVGGSTAMIN